MKTIFFLFLVFAFPALADGISFKFDLSSKHCLDETGKKGRNQDYLGECGYLERKTFMTAPGEKLDLSGKIFSGSVWRQTNFGFVLFKESDFNSANIRREFRSGSGARSRRQTGDRSVRWTEEL